LPRSAQPSLDLHLTAPPALREVRPAAGVGERKAGGGSIQKDVASRNQLTFSKDGTDLGHVHDDALSKIMCNGALASRAAAADDCEHANSAEGPKNASTGQLPPASGACPAADCRRNARALPKASKANKSE